MILRSVVNLIRSPATSILQVSHSLVMVCALLPPLICSVRKVVQHRVPSQAFIQLFLQSRGHIYQIARCKAPLVGWLFLPSGKKYSRGNLVLVGILAFYAVKIASLFPLSLPPFPALCTGAAPQASSWWMWVPTAHSLPVSLSDSTQPSVSDVIICSVMRDLPHNRRASW